VTGSLHAPPAGLPVPVDDGATAHRPGAAVPAVTRPGASRRAVGLPPLAAVPGVVPARLRERRA
jgi:hypothetical protein